MGLLAFNFNSDAGGTTRRGADEKTVDFCCCCVGNDCDCVGNDCEVGGDNGHGVVGEEDGLRVRRELKLDIVMSFLISFFFFLFPSFSSLSLFFFERKKQEKKKQNFYFKKNRFLKLEKIVHKNPLFLVGTFGQKGVSHPKKDFTFKKEVFFSFSQKDFVEHNSFFLIFF